MEKKIIKNQGTKDLGFCVQRETLPAYTVQRLPTD